MPIKFNPLIFSGLDLAAPSNLASPLYKAPVDTEGDLPTPATDGEARVVRSTDHIYVYDGTEGEWVDTGLTEAEFGTTPNANGYNIEEVVEGGIRRNALVLQPADATNPGGVSTDTQSFSGIKSFETELRLPYAADASSPARLDANKALISGAIDLSSADTTGQLDASRIGNGDVDNTELSYVNGVTSSIQTQLDNRLLRSSGDIDETLFIAANNVAIQTDITGFAFASTVRSFEAQVNVQLDATVDAYEIIKLTGINKNGSWVMFAQELGDDSGVDFFITSGGQVQYTSANAAGFVSLEIKFRALTLND